MSEPTATCWSCGADRAPADALCPSCAKVQPPAAGNAPDKFAVLGLPRGFELEARQLDERFRTLSRKLHPDRFARATARERRFSLEQTTLLNDAYRTLQDPARRAEHLLELRGVRPLSDTAMPEEFLE
ncbi:MAG: Fe-S protein assembly co-chaperone HscB, partial [Deltaproteobacteria bacterium]